MAINQEERRRAAEYVAQLLANRGWDVRRLAAEARLSPETVQTFVVGEDGIRTWPQRPKRAAIEHALGLGEGSLEMVARLMVKPPADEDDEMDPVERAIRRSTLSRANQHRLIGEYFTMLEAQEREVRGA